jgi:hypothetical protein
LRPGVKSCLKGASIARVICYARSATRASHPALCSAAVAELQWEAARLPPAQRLVITAGRSRGRMQLFARNVVLDYLRLLWPDGLNKNPAASEGDEIHVLPLLWFDNCE